MDYYFTEDKSQEVLIGGIETIKKFKPIIIFENCDDNHNGCPDYVVKYYTINNNKLF